MRIPRWEGKAWVVGAQISKPIYVKCIKHQLNRLPANTSPAEPYKGAQSHRQSPDIQFFARSKRVEVPGKYMHPLFCIFEQCNQGSQLPYTPSFCPIGMQRAQVHAKNNSGQTRWLDL